MPGPNIFIIFLFLIGGVFILLQILLRRSRAYLLYFGLAIILSGVIALLPEGIRPYGVIFEIAVILMLFYEAIQDMKDRVKRMREEHQQRAEAFGEFLQALAERERSQESTSDGGDSIEVSPQSEPNTR